MVAGGRSRVCLFSWTSRYTTHRRRCATHAINSMAAWYLGRCRQPTDLTDSATAQPMARGIEMLQLTRPFQQAGRVRIDWSCEVDSASPWHVRTSNVQRIRLYELEGGWNRSCVPKAGLRLDGCSFSAEQARALLEGAQHLVRSVAAMGEGTCH